MRTMITVEDVVQMKHMVEHVMMHDTNHAPSEGLSGGDAKLLNDLHAELTRRIVGSDKVEVVAMCDDGDAPQLACTCGARPEDDWGVDGYMRGPRLELTCQKCGRVWVEVGSVFKLTEGPREDDSSDEGFVGPSNT